MSNEDHLSQAQVAPFSTGWVPDRFDGRDLYYVPLHRVDATAQSGINLRKHQTYGKFFGEVYDQSPWGTCVANAVSAAFAYEWKRQDLGELSPSRLFLFWNSRSVCNDNGIPGQDPNSKDGKSGTLIRGAMKALSKVGVCSESDWKYTQDNFGTKPTDDVFKKALPNLSMSYYRLDPDNPEELDYRLRKDERETIGNLTLLRLRQCLAEGYPVTFGFNIYHKNISEPIVLVNGQAQLPKLPSPLPPNREDGKSDNYREAGHAVVAIGYDDKEQRVLCQNSWGADLDFFYVGYEWIRDYEATRDFWMIRIVTKDGNKGKEIKVDGELPRDAQID